jgi:CRISPR-associated protein Csm3
MTKQIKLKGRVIFTFTIRAETGLHIGGSDTGIEIGGVDKTVIRDPLTNTPYIPGSSLKGKMRSLLEKYRGLPQNQRIGRGFIHSCGAEYTGKELETKGKKDYDGCDICQVFGLPGERPFATPTRLVVRDIHLSQASIGDLNRANTDLPYTEVKTEVSIDRVTSEANPRQLERVPAGAVFGDQEKPAEMIYSVYSGDDCDPGKDIERLKTLIEGLALLEEDYLGGSGSRGSGKVKIEKIHVFVRSDYAKEAEDISPKEGYSVPELVSALKSLQDKIKAALA